MKKTIVYASVLVVSVAAVAFLLTSPTLAALTFSDTGVASSGVINLDGAGAVSIGATNATSIAIGKSGITTSVNGNSAFDTNTLFVDGANHRVGIGTTSPSYQLELSDALYARNVGDGDLSGVDIFGREYLYAFTKKLMDGGVPVVVLAGDSTTAGSGLEVTLKKILTRNYPDVTIYNDGVSGINTNQWLNTYLAGQIARNPDLMVVRFGINDGASNRTDFEANLRTALATIRATRPVDLTTIVLMTPNSTNDTPNGRDDAWYKIAVPIIRKAARDYQCTYIDTYTAFRDSANASAWMDDPFGDGRHIHPGPVENLAIANLITEVIFPAGVRNYISSSIVNAGGFVGIGTGDVAPVARFQVKGSVGSTFFLDSNQLSMNRNPLDGTVIDSTVGSATIVMGPQSNGSYIALWTGDAAGGGVGERMRINRNGQVGIGTNNPSYLLDINGTTRVSGRLLEAQGAAVASTNDLVLGNDGNFFRIAGDAQINAIATSGWTAGSRITLVFNAGAIVKNNTAGGAGTASMLLSGGADFTASANDVLTLIYDGTNWLEVSRSVN